MTLEAGLYHNNKQYEICVELGKHWWIFVIAFFQRIDYIIFYMNKNITSRSG